MENNAMHLQETMMSMLNNQLEMLQVELNDAYASLGRATMEKHSSEDYTMFFERKDICSICEEKVRLMKKIIDKISGIYGSQVPMLAKI